MKKIAKKTTPEKKLSVKPKSLNVQPAKAPVDVFAARAAELKKPEPIKSFADLRMALLGKKMRGEISINELSAYDKELSRIEQGIKNGK